ncbi:hypothetical protein [Klebsiella pneumoniae]|uniref:hypothetical protein n=1 Tax=Klebsiella pneumoniae TaxID=573 RepID=UPI003D557598
MAFDDSQRSVYFLLVMRSTASLRTPATKASPPRLLFPMTKRSATLFSRLLFDWENNRSASGVLATSDDSILSAFSRCSGISPLTLQMPALG